MILAVDPSLRSVGLALFERETGTLKKVKRLRPETDTAYSHGQRSFFIAEEIVRWLPSRPLSMMLVFEWPKIYTAVKSKGNPNQLIPLAGIGMAVAGLLNICPQTPTPAEWSGQLPKATKGDVSKSPRAQRILGRLSEEERALVPAQHDILDAVGLGLWVLGRLAPKRVYPR